MALAFGKREKIVVGAVGLLASIALLHLLIFKPRHEQFLAKQEELKVAQATASAGRIPPDPEKVKKEYLDETQKDKELFKTIVSPLVMGFESFFYEAAMDPISGYEREKAAIQADPARQKAGEIPVKFKNDDKIAQTLIDDMKAVLAFKRENPTIKLTFLASGHPWGWQIPEALPKDIASGKENLKDIVEALITAQRSLGNLDKTQTYLVSKQRASWGLVLQRLMDVSDKDAYGNVMDMGSFWNMLNLESGPQVYPLKELMHVNLIVEELARSSGGVARQRTDLIRAFNIDLNPTEMYHAHRQLQYLLEIFKAAKAEGVEEVPRVKLEGRRFLRFDDIWLNTPTPTPEGGTPTPTPTPESLSYGPYGGGGYGALFGGGGMFGLNYNAAPGPTKATETTVKVGEGAPMEICLKGTNQAVTRCLYQIAASPKNYEIDSLSVMSSLVLGKWKSERYYEKYDPAKDPYKDPLLNQVLYPIYGRYYPTFFQDITGEEGKIYAFSRLNTTTIVDASGDLAP